MKENTRQIHIKSSINQAILNPLNQEWIKYNIDASLDTRGKWGVGRFSEMR